VSWRFDAIPFVSHGTEVEDDPTDSGTGSKKRGDTVMVDKDYIDNGAKESVHE
jgi:hypothetical protein